MPAINMFNNRYMSQQNSVISQKINSRMFSTENKGETTIEVEAEEPEN